MGGGGKREEKGGKTWIRSDWWTHVEREMKRDRQRERKRGKRMMIHETPQIKWH